MLNGDDCSHSVSDISAREIGVLFFEYADLAGIVIDHLGENRLEAGQMCAAFRVVDVIAESENILVKLIHELESRFHCDLVAHSLVIDDVRDRLFGFIECPDKTHNTVRFVESDLLRRLFSLICILYDKRGIEISSLVHTALDIFFPEAGLLKDLRIRKKIDAGAGPFGLSHNRKKAVHKVHNRSAALIFVLIKKTAAANADGHPFRKSVDHRRAHSVKSSAGLICIVIKFSAGMERCEHNAFCAHTLFMHSDRNAAPVILHCAGAVRLEYHLDLAAKACQMLVDGVVHDLIDKMVETSCGNTADIHSGSHPDSFKTLEYFYAGCVIIIGFLINICHANFLFLLISRCAGASGKRD